MISYIRGRLASVEEQKAIVEAGGIGYGIYHNRKKSNVKQKEKSD